MASFLKEMETIIKENEKLREENEKLREKNEKKQLYNENEKLREENEQKQKQLYNENIKLRVQINEKNREISEILFSLDKYKQDKISRGEKISSLIKGMNDVSNNLSQIIIEKNKLKIEKDKLQESFDKYHKNSHENAKRMQSQLSQLSKYTMGINQQDQLKNWFDKNCGCFNYRLGKELHDIIS